MERPKPRGRHGRWRSNVWTYPGGSTLGSDSREGLDFHPTVKPRVLLEDALLDVTNRGDIVIDCFALGRMARAHPVSAVVIELASEEGMIVGQRRPPRLRLAFELLLDPVPRFRVDDRRMKAVVDLPFVPQPSDIDRVREDPIEVTPRHQSASGSSACLAHPNRRAKARTVLRRTTLPTSR